MGGHSSHHVETRYCYVESEESKKIREQKEKEEKDKKEAAKELPKFLGVVQSDFSSKLLAKISKVKRKIEKELNNYSPSNLKIFLQKLTTKEKLEEKLIEASKQESEKILDKSYSNNNHFNVLLLGKTGVGKSTLINEILEFEESEGAKTGDGKPITKEFGEYISDKRKGLRFIDSKGIEMGDHNINAVFNATKDLIEKKSRE